jgi:hypothetical protein
MCDTGEEPPCIKCRVRLRQAPGFTKRASAGAWG